MTKYINKYILVFSITAIAFQACSKEFNDPTLRNDDIGGVATVKVFNAAMATQRNNIFVDGVRQMRTAFAYGGAVPAHAGDLGFTLAPGVRNIIIRDTLNTSTQPVLSFAIDAKAGKSYSVFMYDSLTDVKQLNVENNFIKPPANKALIRFVNLLYSKRAVPDVTVSDTTNRTVLWSGIAKTQVTEYVEVEAGSSSVYNFFDPIGGRSFGLLSLTPTPGRVYTIILRGSYLTPVLPAPAATIAVTINTTTDW